MKIKDTHGSKTLRKTAPKPIVKKKSDVPNKKSKDMNAPVRLNKFLADSGVASRRASDELIESGAVKINGKVVVELGTKVTKSDFITVNGDPIKEKKNLIYILLNKPKNVITTTSDEKGRKTVLDIVRKHVRIFPVGRLDRNTTGALILTNDGDLAHRLTHPSYQIERIYNVKLDKNLQFDHAKQIAEGGIDLGDNEITGVAELMINPEDRTKVVLKLKEGKNREVRRIFEHFEYEVKQLTRKYFAHLTITGMKIGEYRHLTRKEVLELKRLVKL
ncbi:MAG TPA: pseudouridine synthase [Candidatus Kapabacteria bacterium]|nr:pseudouridine synthase [Candidatus Kapabacteria bacterium]